MKFQLPLITLSLRFLLVIVEAAAAVTTYLRNYDFRVVALKIYILCTKKYVLLSFLMQVIFIYQLFYLMYNILNYKILFVF